MSISNQGILNTETVESEEDLKPDVLSGLKEPISISNRGMKQTRGCCLMKNVKDCLVSI